MARAARTDLPAAGRRWWPRLRRLGAALFLGGVLVLLALLGRDLDWPAVGRALRALSPGTLLLAFLLAVASHALYSTYDLVGRRVTRHALSAGRVMAVCWIAYAFTLNFGAMVGGIGFRFRLYLRLGLGSATIAQVFAHSLLTNWLGYCLLAALAFAWQPVPLPPGWALGEQGQQWLGTLLPLLPLAYLAVGSLARKRSWTLRGQLFRLPSGPITWLQCAMSTLNWLLIAAVIHVLLGERVDYLTVLGAAMLSSGAGLIVRVPGGLGVLEAVFVGLLASPQLPATDVLAALLAYRALYYLLPLLAALAAYGAMEWRMRHRRPAG